ncbi:hypothetical protein GLOTRDRAFT_128979 [Gloeophyllum trabeum ATCC 11539]|uniref:Carboxymuconolactone decarboxylase-like domain-containing protein n=1 Tax=Gloeophyllum trabeum (strain ATCC 11539 / FP-39264 / Madison 617) TaxID=670483 RepID=S7Q8A4_GLOTA|nr:uncharacterized protein GLOTRDRAFT_128979 [Gloeophyllum trabeum ATCC 11539]EPQ55762.1 hypothetical protein GLOTRDRAFT_128979 [Gloeophyllum trabeum ATCC 11539]
MAHLATPELLDRIKSLYPTSSSPPATAQEYLQNPYFFAAAVVFSAFNYPEAIPAVFQSALNDIKGLRASEDEQRHLVRKIRDALFKCGILIGYPKAINGLVALYGATPENLRDKEMIRDKTLPTEHWTASGQKYFNETYGETAEQTQKLLESIYPDFGFFCITHAYGYAYSFSDLISGLENSYIMLVSNIAMDVPRQIEWHLKGSVRNGGSPEQVKAVREIAVEVGKAAGAVWRNEIPQLGQ